MCCLTMRITSRLLLVVALFLSTVTASPAKEDPRFKGKQSFPVFDLRGQEGVIDDRVLRKSERPDEIFGPVDSSRKVAIIYFGSDQRLFKEVVDAAVVLNATVRVVGVAFVAPVYRRDNSVTVVVGDAVVLNCTPVSHDLRKNLDLLSRAVSTAHVSAQRHLSKARTENARRILENRGKLVALEQAQLVQDPSKTRSALEQSTREYESRKIELQLRETEEAQVRQTWLEHMKGSPCGAAYSRLPASK
jgi:hypothetical protein